MSNWWSAWLRIRERLRALDQGWRFMAMHMGPPGDHGVVPGFAKNEALECLRELGDFRAKHAETLPERAESALRELEGLRGVLTDTSNTRAIASASAILGFAMGAIEYHLADRERKWRSIVERAFVHLDRLVVADNDVRRKWGVAFKNGETSCEKLGGAHLLFHGIWGFKARSEGERTDLILGTPMTTSDTDRAASAAEVMVLTEWKLVREREELVAKRDEAVVQMKVYGHGSMAGFEMSETRYAVTVAKERFEPLEPLVLDRITYRHVHVSVVPPTPSKYSKGKKLTVAGGAGDGAGGG